MELQSSSQPERSSDPASEAWRLSQEIEQPELPPADHGKGAWLALLGCVLAQVPIWGKKLRYPVNFNSWSDKPDVFQVSLLHGESFKNIYRRPNLENTPVVLLSLGLLQVQVLPPSPHRPT